MQSSASNRANAVGAMVVFDDIREGDGFESSDEDMEV